MTENSRGVCPQTGEACEKLLEVSEVIGKPRRQHPEIFAPGAFADLAPDQRRIYNETIAKDVVVNTLNMMPRRLGCAGGCALRSVDIPDFVRRRTL